MTTEVPLIWTTKGNVPVESLSYSTAWEIVPGEFIKFVETYKDGEEIVKQSAHIYSLKSLFSEAQAQSIG
jgi:hypothetical protein